jgi:hypothetical protein
MLLDFSDSSFGSNSADGKNCMTSYCEDGGYVIFVKVYCNTTDGSVKGVCGKYGFIDLLIVLIMRPIYLA